MNICIFEDEGCRNFFPFLDIKPFVFLIYGNQSILERARLATTPHTLTLHTRTYLTALAKEQTTLPVNILTNDDTLFINARLILFDFIIHKIQSNFFQPNTCYSSGGEVAIFRCTPSQFFSEGYPDLISSQDILSKFPVEQIRASLIHFPWEIISRHSDQLRQDLEFCQAEQSGEIHSSAILVSSENIIIKKGANVQAGVILDATEGKIYIGENATVQAGTIVCGNTYLDNKSTVSIGATLRGDLYIGKQSKVGGEVKNVIMEDYSNKQHDGFMGETYLSSWCNVGAGAITSNLKNNYSSIRMRIQNKDVDTKMMFLGTIMGEHSKVGINTSLSAGTMIGVSSSIFENPYPPKFISSFNWGGKPGNTYQIDKAIDTATIVMARRKKTCSDAYQEAMRGAFQKNFSLYQKCTKSDS